MYNVKGRDMPVNTDGVIFTVVIGREIVLSMIHVTHITMYTPPHQKKNKIKKIYTAPLLTC